MDTSAKILLDFVKKTQNRKLLEGNLDLHKWLYQQGLHIYDRSIENTHTFLDSTNSGRTCPSQLAYILLSCVPSGCQSPVHDDPEFRKTNQVL